MRFEAEHHRRFAGYILSLFASKAAIPTSQNDRGKADRLGLRGQPPMSQLGNEQPICERWLKSFGSRIGGVGGRLAAPVAVYLRSLRRIETLGCAAPLSVDIERYGLRLQAFCRDERRRIDDVFLSS